MAAHAKTPGPKVGASALHTDPPSHGRVQAVSEHEHVSGQGGIVDQAFVGQLIGGKHRCFTPDLQFLAEYTDGAERLGLFAQRFTQGDAPNAKRFARKFAFYRQRSLGVTDPGDGLAALCIKTERLDPQFS